VTERDSDLLKNLLLFSGMLRDRGFNITLTDVVDTLRGASLIDLHRKVDFHSLLKSNFVSRKEELDLFDELFEAFWSVGDSSTPPRLKPSEEPLRIDEEKEEVSPPRFQKKEFLPRDEEIPEEEQASPEKRERAAYSPEEVLGDKDFARLKKEELDTIKEAVLQLARRVSVTLSRRWKRGNGGDRIDFRRSMRRSLKYGGEIIELTMKKPKPRPLRLVLICDVSGSMDIYSRFFLLFMFGLQNYYPHCETFTFSTRLSHVSPLLKGRTFEEALQWISRKVLDWSGGTNIGLSLHQFHLRHSDLLHRSRTLLLIFSDGWDRGDTRLLDSEMRYIKGQVRGVIWLNPLMGSPDYQPLCKGMSTALPYLDCFMPYHNLASLKDLARLISRRGLIPLRSPLESSRIPLEHRR
jgi:uncharacterized protein